MINAPITVALNDSSYTKIALPVSPKINNVFNPISAYTSPKTDWYISSNLAGTDAVIVYASEGDIYNNSRVKADVDGAIMYAKSASGTPDLIVHVGLESKSRNNKV